MKRSIRLHQRNAVVGDLVDIGQQALDLYGKRLVHREINARIGHDFIEVRADLADDPRRQRDLRDAATQNGVLGINAGDHGCADRFQVKCDGRR